MKFPARAAILASVVASAFTVARPARAQDSGDGFRFQRPSGSWSLRGGYAMPNAGSDIFSFTTSNMTVDRGSFSGLDFGADLSFTITPRLDLVVDVAYSGASKGAEYRNFLEQGQPIQQTTSFQRTPVTVSARYYLSQRGRQIGHYAWVPSRVTPYVGAGVGMMYYEFNQKGDFVSVDSSTHPVSYPINPDALHSGGWAPMAQLLAGAEWSMGPGWALRTEARYLTASAALSSDFQGFHRIDLSGVSTSVGFFVRF